MIPRRRNSCVYTGLVGAKMRPAKPRRKPVLYVTHVAENGPFRGRPIRTEAGQPHTLEFTVPGWPPGRYIAGTWAPVLQAKPSSQNTP